jgi:hypothetical protein
MRRRCDGDRDGDCDRIATIGARLTHDVDRKPYTITRSNTPRAMGIMPP